MSIQGIEGVNNEIGVIGCDYDLLKDLPDQPVELVLRGMSGSTANIMLHSPNRSFSEVIINNQPMDFKQFQNGDLKIEFSGKPLLEPWHRKIAPLDPCDLPQDADALYEISCFTASNNCLEVRSLVRSGPTNIPEVQAARDGFFNQAIFKTRGVWDKFAFDGKESTRWFCPAAENTSLRINFEEPIELDTLVVKGAEDDFYDHDEITIEVSSNLSEWETITGKVITCLQGSPSDSNDIIYYESPDNEEIPFNPQKSPLFFGESRVPFPIGEQKYAEFTFPQKSIQYVRFLQNPLYVFEINGKKENEWVTDRSKWHGSFTFYHPAKKALANAWKAEFSLNEIAPGILSLCRIKWDSRPRRGVCEYESRWETLRITESSSFLSRCAMGTFYYDY